MNNKTEKMTIEEVAQNAKVHLDRTLEAFERTGKASRSAQINYRSAALKLSLNKSA